MTTQPSDSPATSSITTVPDNDGAQPDVVSDPAKDDTQGQDWSDEGGATPTGPATATAG